MKSFKEMRQEAWKTATSRWVFRLLSVMFFFILLGLVVFTPLTGYYRDNSVQSWGMFMQSQTQYMAAGLDFSVPSSHQFWSMTCVSGFNGFLKALYNGLMLFGLLSVALKAVRREEQGWFGSALGGFRAPLEMLWLNVLMAIRITLWSLLFVVPGIIAAFRYAMAWYVKCDHPDYSAARCLAESGRLMDGHKWELFCYGFTYFGWLLLVLCGTVLSGVISVMFPAAAPLANPAAFALLAFVMAYVVLGQAVYYTELKKLSEKPEGSEDL